MCLFEWLFSLRNFEESCATKLWKKMREFEGDFFLSNIKENL